MYVSYRHTNLMLHYASPTTFAPAVYWRLILWLGQLMPVTRVLLRLGRTPPRYMGFQEQASENVRLAPTASLSKVYEAGKHGRRCVC